MNCLTCRELLMVDHEDDRRFLCGHHDIIELDSSCSAPEIVSVPWNGSEELKVLQNGPKWCPRERPTESQA